MIEEKKVLQTMSAGEYLAPSVRVKALKPCQILCSSSELEGYSNQEEETNEWFNN